ncbi:Uncharacterized protein FWK35_00035013, partial [Aphis craccivora]
TFYAFLLSNRDANTVTIWLDNCNSQNKNWCLFTGPYFYVSGLLSPSGRAVTETPKENVTLMILPLLLETQINNYKAQQKLTKSTNRILLKDIVSVQKKCYKNQWNATSNLINETTRDSIRKTR